MDGPAILPSPKTNMMEPFEGVAHLVRQVFGLNNLFIALLLYILAVHCQSPSPLTARLGALASGAIYSPFKGVSELSENRQHGVFSHGSRTIDPKIVTSPQMQAPVKPHCPE